MPRLHALELVPDDDGAAAVRADWQALRDAGLASMLDHPSDTNSPHVTVLAVPVLAESVEHRAVDLLGPLLPVRARAAGLAVFGGDRLTLVRLVDVSDAVTRAVLDLRAATSGHQHPGWSPHVTLARRLPRGDLQRAVDVVGRADRELSLTGLRRWDPAANEVRRLG